MTKTATIVEALASIQRQLAGELDVLHWAINESEPDSQRYLQSAWGAIDLAVQKIAEVQKRLSE